MELLIAPDGRVRAVYSETIDLGALGVVHIRRASHVDPDEDGRWWADLSPVGGPALGPFAHRSQALGAEQDWLDAFWLTASRDGSRARIDAVSPATSRPPLV
jgi:hypothetical protein